jgi:ectoine hydroxylase-related dioxygenase (phytanoyl-CoA dioxygenase family)
MERGEREELLRSLGAGEESLSQSETAALDRDGYVVLPGILSADQLARARAALDKLISQARLDPTWHAGGTLHLNDLVNEPAFDPVWKSDRLLSGIVHVIGFDLRVGSVAYRAPQPGYGAQTLHADFMRGYRGEYRGEHQVATAIVALVDFTERNGATRVIPGSHLPGEVSVPSDADTPHPAQRFVTCSAGSAIVFNGHLLHSGTRNASQETRHALQLTFARHTARITGTGRIENATLDRVGDAAFLFL